MPNNVGREYVLRSFLSSVVGDLCPILLIVLGATALLLILACVNVTNLPRLDTVPFDWRVLSFSLAVLVACGLAMGIVPAGRLAVTDIKTVLNDERVNARRRLTDGDVFRLGGTAIAFRHPQGRGAGTTRWRTCEKDHRIAWYP